jgi:hypothetical protein
LWMIKNGRSLDRPFSFVSSLQLSNQLHTYPLLKKSDIIVLMGEHGRVLKVRGSTPLRFLKIQRGRQMDLIFVLTLATLFLLTPGAVSAEEKTVIGSIEDVILLPWGVKLPARVDTGAAKSSLDARELRVQDDMVEFKLPQQYGGLQLRLPIIEWRHIRTPEGRERRPIVELEICLGSKQVRTKVNLTDRSMVKYPLILGRSFLREDYVVDVKRRRTSPPSCPKIP